MVIAHWIPALGRMRLSGDEPPPASSRACSDLQGESPSICRRMRRVSLVGLDETVDSPVTWAATWSGGDGCESRPEPRTLRPGPSLRGAHNCRPVRRGHEPWDPGARCVLRGGREPYPSVLPGHPCRGAAPVPRCDRDPRWRRRPRDTGAGARGRSASSAASRRPPRRRGSTPYGPPWRTRRGASGCRRRRAPPAGGGDPIDRLLRRRS
jgi:hypothetical protein